MITIKDNRCEFAYPVDTDEKKVMNTLSPKAFELSSVSKDVRMLMLCIDQKYGKGCALKMFGLVVSDIYTLEEIDKVNKEISGNE